MRASIRRIFPQRQRSEGDGQNTLRVSLYEDTIPRVPPTPGLRPLHGTVPDHLRRQTSQHQRSKSMPANNAAHARRSAPGTAQSHGVAPPDPISKDWARPNQTGGRDRAATSPTANDSSNGGQLGRPISEYHSNDHRHWSPSQPSASQSHLHTDGRLSQDKSRARGPPQSHNGGSSHVSGRGALYGEDIADRNIAERQRGYRSSKALDTATSGTTNGINGTEPSLEDGLRGRPRRQSPYSHAQIYNSAGDVAQQPAEDDQRPRRKWTVTRKPVGSGTLDPAFPSRPKGLGHDSAVNDGPAGPPVPQKSYTTNRNSFRTTEPFNPNGMYNDQNDNQYQSGPQSGRSEQRVGPSLDSNRSRHRESKSTAYSKQHSNTGVDELERRLGTMGVLDLKSSKDTTIHETIAPGKQFCSPAILPI